MRPGALPSRAAGIALLALLALAVPATADRASLRDAPPVWWEADDAPLAQPPAPRDPNLYADMLRTTVRRPVDRHVRPDRAVRTIGGWFGASARDEAANANALDEVPSSTWFTNRIGLFPMTPEASAAGAGDGAGPDRGAPWEIVSAKTEGVTPGFNIRDARGAVWVVKFDPPGHLGVTTGAGAIAGRILHAAGYHVPQDDVVTFRRENLVLGEGVRIRGDDGRKRPMTGQDLEEILARVDPLAPGEYRAIASRFLDGTPLGPFDWKGVRDDDPNDRIPHEDRRELRGLHVLAAWLSHFDTKQHNTLTMLVGGESRPHVRHYLIDFASTLGSGARGPSAKHAHEYGFDVRAIGRRLVTLGLLEDRWRTLEPPAGLPEVGYFYADGWDPRDFEPLQPNTAFAMTTDRDAYWAAKIVTAFTDEHLAAIVETARYRDPAATARVADVLAARRDTIGRIWFDRVCPLDYFRVEGDRLVVSDLGVERGLWSEAQTRRRVRTWTADAERRGDRPAEWHSLDGLELARPAPAAGDPPFRAFELQVDRGEGWGPSVVAWVAPASGRVVAVDR